MGKCAAIVVMYNPEFASICRNINSYVEQVDYVILIDNSDDEIKRDNILFQRKVIYCSLSGNKGIAAAFNKGFSLASKLGCSWVITFDQDSFAPKNMIYCMNHFVEQSNLSKIGIVAPLVKFFPGYVISDFDSSYREVCSVISSGSYINMNAYYEVGGFNERLFIDEVDIEFCMRLRIMGYKIIELPNLVLEHHLGNSYQLRLFGKHVAFVTNHNYIRRYYMTRNSLFIVKQFWRVLPKESWNLLFGILKDFIKVILFEKDKALKVRAIFIGFYDASCNLMGKLNESRILK